jgi:hypothetical protein
VLRNLVLLVSSALALAFTAPASTADEKKAARPPEPEKEATFELREVGVFELARRPGTNTYSLARGQYVECQTEPDPKVRAYPKLKSEHPLYGKVKFGAAGGNAPPAVEYHFVIDESGEPPPEPKRAGLKPGDGTPGAAKPATAGSLLKTLVSSLSGETSSGTARPAAQPRKTPITYDRLYFDANRDLDLTNDPVLLPMQAPPAGATFFTSASVKQTVIYDYLAIPFDYGPGLGTRPFRLLPRLMISRTDEGRQYASLFFVATVARQGRIRIGSQRYDVVLGQPYRITGRFDVPGTAMLLAPLPFFRQAENWWGSDEVAAIRRVDGRYYTSSVTPLGDKLTVNLYQGDLGTLRLGPGKRHLARLSMYGSLHSPAAAVAVSDPAGAGRRDAKPVTEFRLPVGDYVPAFLTVEYGRLHIGLSENYHSDGHPRDPAKTTERSAYAFFKIRKDRPFVLDFSHQPKVLFASPAPDQTLKPGDTLRVAAVLTDPELDIMIRHLDDTSRKQDVTYELPGGKKQSYQRSVSLDPAVTITNSSGKRVAEGKLPFG